MWHVVHTTQWGGVESRWRGGSTSMRGLSLGTPLQASHTPVLGDRGWGLGVSVQSR